MWSWAYSLLGSIGAKSAVSRLVKPTSGCSGAQGTNPLVGQFAPATGAFEMCRIDHTDHVGV